MERLYPKRIYLVINNVCNARCKFCDVGQRNIKASLYKALSESKGDMDISLFKKLVNDIKPHGTYIDVKGTEPLLKKDLLDFIRVTKEAGLSMNITTNGFLLPKFAEDFVRLGLDDIQVSIDGIGKVNDDIRGLPGVYERASSAIRRMVELKRETGSKLPRIRINFAITNVNFQGMKECLLAFRDMGAELVTLQHLNFISQGHADHHNSMVDREYSVAPSSIAGDIDPKKADIDAMHASIQEAKTVKKTREFNYKFIPDLDLNGLRDFYFNEEKFVGAVSKCKYLWWSTSVKSNGDIVPHVRCYPVVMGNVAKDSMVGVFNSEKYNAMREALMKMGGRLPACSRCCGIVSGEQRDGTQDDYFTRHEARTRPSAKAQG